MKHHSKLKKLKAGYFARAVSRQFMAIGVECLIEVGQAEKQEHDDDDVVHE